MERKAKKVFVGMSGGVDSSVSAAMLLEEGYDVTGVFIKVWHPDWLPCEWKEERRDAMRVAAHLNIPFITLDLEKEYKEGVVDYMLDEYKKGRTPNPDVMCNKEVKFGSFLKKAREMGADFIATGHYAQNRPHPNPLLTGEGKRRLEEGVDPLKDQSYFLWTLTHEQLQHVLFPVGHLEKKQVRELAKKYQLPTAEKKDSQGICFIGKVDMKEFLQHYMTSEKGQVVNEQGEALGMHDGALFYTIGQRHGFTISQKTPDDSPYYIIAKDIKNNTLTVSQKTAQVPSHKNTKALGISQFSTTTDTPLDFSKEYTARIRYHGKKLTCNIQDEKTVIFQEPQEALSEGQSIVFYDGAHCVGGGIIERVR